MEAEVHEVTGYFLQEVSDLRGREVGAVASMIQSDLRILGNFLLGPFRAGIIIEQQSADGNLGLENSKSSSKTWGTPLAEGEGVRSTLLQGHVT